MKAFKNKRIHSLKQIIIDCDNVFFRSVNMAKTLDGPHMVVDSILTKERMNFILHEICISWDETFETTTIFSKEYIQ